MNKRITVVLSLLLIILVGCSANKYIDIVKNGHYMATTKTNNEVFYKCFNTCSWTSKKNFGDDFVTVVFTAKALYQGIFKNVKVVYRVQNNNSFQVADYYINEEPVLSIEFIELVTSLYFK